MLVFRECRCACAFPKIHHGSLITFVLEFLTPRKPPTSSSAISMARFFGELPGEMRRILALLRYVTCRTPQGPEIGRRISMFLGCLVMSTPQLLGANAQAGSS